LIETRCLACKAAVPTALHAVCALVPFIFGILKVTVCFLVVLTPTTVVATLMEHLTLYPRSLKYTEFVGLYVLT
jgi:hypothetical protein